MTYIKTIILTSLIFLTQFLTGCGGLDLEPEDYIEPSLPKDLREILDSDVLAQSSFYKGAPYYAETDSRYDDVRTKFDLIVPACDTLCPVVVYIHGGAFTSGDKNRAYTYRNNGKSPEESPILYGTKELLERGIAVATLNYHYLADDGSGLVVPLNDVVRAIKTIKFFGNRFGVSPSRMMLSGSSAGAGAALWVGLSDDFADTDSFDIVEMQSTAVKGIYAYRTQATYDILRWEQDVMPGVPVVSDLLGGNSDLQSARGVIRKAYGMDSWWSRDQLLATDVTIKRERLDMLDLMSAGDTELWIDNSTVQGSYQSLRTIDAFYHGPEHAVALHNRARQLGINHTTVIRDSSGALQTLSSTGDANVLDFAERILGM